MKFNVSATALRERLQVLSKLLPSKPTTPIFDCFLFDLSGNILKITVSDGDSVLISELEVNNEGADGRVAVVGKKLMEIVHAYGDQALSFDIDEKTLAITIKTESGHSSFVGQPASEYPEYSPLQEDVTTFSVPGKIMMDGIAQTAFAAANDELRPIMSSVYFDMLPEGLTLVATDSHKLSRYKIPSIQSSEHRGFAFPLKPVMIAKSLFAAADDVMEIGFDSKYITCKTSLYLLKCRQVEGKYPPYEKVIPALPLPVSVVVDRKSLIAALRRVMVCTDQASSLIKMSISNGQLVIFGQDINFSVQGEEHLPCQYEGESMEIGFKAATFDNILNALDSDEVVMNLTDKQRPGIFVPATPSEGSDVLMLLMPMML